MNEYIVEISNRISETAPRYAAGLLVVFGVYLVAKLLSGLLKKRLEKHSSDKILTHLISRIFHWILIVFGIIWGMNIAGLSDIAMSLLAGAGVSAFILGFAFKDIAENFLSGIILAFNRPFNIGDTIETAQIIGKVTDLDLRNTHIKTFDGKDVYVPNALILKEPLVNSSKDNTLRHEFMMTVDYNENIDAVSELIISTIKSVDGVHTEKNPFVSVQEFSSLGVKLKVHFWVKLKDADVSPIKLRRVVQSEVKDALIKEDISIPKSIFEESTDNNVR